MNTEDFVTYEQALTLKKLGFNENVNHYYNDKNNLIEALANYNNEDSYNSSETSYDDFNHCDEVSCSAPTLWEVQKWLRKEKGLYIEIHSKIDVDFFKYTILAVNLGVISEDLEYVYNSPEEALSAGITECIKLLEKED